MQIMGRYSPSGPACRGWARPLLTALVFLSLGHSIQTYRNFIRSSGVTLHDTCNRDHISSAVSSSRYCQPVKKIVRLELPSNVSFTQMTPSHVSVSRCGGGCHHSGHSCVATEQTLKQIPVILFRCGLSAGLCDKVCASVSVAEDTRCQCQCLEAGADQAACDPDLHHVNPQTCQCECKQESEYVLCREQGRLWDSRRCVCSCPQSLVKPCSSGFVFDSASTCSCVPLHELDNSISEDGTRVAKRSESAGLKVALAENIIIITLSGVTVTFFLIIISLLRTISSLRYLVTSYRLRHGREEGGGEAHLLAQETS